MKNETESFPLLILTSLFLVSFFLCHTRKSHTTGAITDQIRSDCFFFHIWPEIKDSLYKQGNRLSLSDESLWGVIKHQLDETDSSEWSDMSLTSQNLEVNPAHRILQSRVKIITTSQWWMGGPCINSATFLSAGNTHISKTITRPSRSANRKPALWHESLSFAFAILVFG